MSARGLGRLLDEHPAAPEAPLIHTVDASLIVADARAAATRLADQLRAAGLVPGHAVALVIDDSMSALVAALGTWIAGGVLVPLNARLTDAELTKAIADESPAITITACPGRLPTGSAFLEQTATARWETVGTASAHARRHVGDAALVMRTSGTTGEPKAVVMRHEGVLGGIDTVAGQLRARAASTGKAAMPNLIPMSLGLWAGLWNAIFGLRVGAPLVLMDRFDTAEFATLVRRYEIRSTILAPAMMSMLSADVAVEDLSPLRLVRSVTAPLTPAQARTFRGRFGVDVLNCYGQTELGSEVIGWTAQDLREHGEAKLGAVGRAHPGVDVKVVDDKSVVLPAGASGELWIRSPFLGQADASIAARLDADGYLRTGDLGFVDAEGFVWLEGRVSDMINRGGLKVTPQEVEDALRRQGGVADACVAGVPDDRLGELPVAWVVPIPGSALDPDALRDALRAELAPYKIPAEVVLVEDLPRNEIGKVLRRSLIEGHR